MDMSFYSYLVHLLILKKIKKNIALVFFTYLGCTVNLKKNTFT